MQYIVLCVFALRGGFYGDNQPMAVYSSMNPVYSLYGKCRNVQSVSGCKVNSLITTLVV